MNLSDGAIIIIGLVAAGAATGIVVGLAGWELATLIGRMRRR